MESAFAWLGQLVEWFGSLFPRVKVVHWTHEAVFLRAGQRPKVRGPGIYVTWPFITTMWYVNKLRIVEAISTEPCQTSDDVTVRVEVNLTFHISDSYVYVAENEDSGDSLDDVAAAAVASFVMDSEYDYLRSCIDEEAEGLLEEIQRIVSPFGITLETARFTGIAKTRCFSVDT